MIIAKIVLGKLLMSPFHFPICKCPASAAIFLKILQSLNKLSISARWCFLVSYDLSRPTSLTLGDRWMKYLISQTSSISCERSRYCHHAGGNLSYKIPSCSHLLQLLHICLCQHQTGIFITSFCKAKSPKPKHH